MGLDCLPPLPIATLPFKFLKSLDLISMGRGLGDVSSSFGWELVEWKSSVNLIRFEKTVRPDEGFTEVCEVLEVEDDVSEDNLEPKIDLDLGTRSEPVLDFGDASSESLPVFEDYQVIPLKRWVRLTMMKGYKHQMNQFLTPLLVKP